jgi:hypothetical protein
MSEKEPFSPLLPSHHYGQAFVSLNRFALLRKVDPNCAYGERGTEGCIIRAGVLWPFSVFVGLQPFADCPSTDLS